MVEIDASTLDYYLNKKNFPKEQQKWLKEAQKEQGLLKVLTKLRDLYALEPYYLDWVNLMHAEKQPVIKNLYKNYAASTLSKIEKHYNKVFDAKGKFEEINFSDDVELELAYKEVIQPELVEDERPLKYFKESYIKHLIYEPSNFFITIPTKEGYVKSYIFDFLKVEAFCFDEKMKAKYITYKKSENLKFIITREFAVLYDTKDEIIKDGIVHGLGYVPYTFISDKHFLDNPLKRISPLSYSLEDIGLYNIFFTFYNYSVSDSAFSKELRPQSRSAFGGQDRNHKVTNPRGGQDKPQNQQPPQDQRKMAIFGQVLEIPVNYQKAEFISVYKEMFHRFDGNIDQLEFLDKLTDKLEQKILSVTLGATYEKEGQGTNKTAAEVHAAYDTQETNLKAVKSGAERALIGVNTDACILTEYINDFNLLNIEQPVNLGELLTLSNTPIKFKRYYINLGEKFFLKDVDTLTEELKNIKSVTSHAGLIKEKTDEIFFSKNAGAISKEYVYHLIFVLIPFSDKSEDWVTKNRANLDTFALFLYDNANTLLSLFDEKTGGLDNFAKNKKNNRKRYVREKFLEFSKEEFENRYIVESQIQEEAPVEEGEENEGSESN